jgi:N-dimethylarginine dimethylaminohydrolase
MTRQSETGRLQRVLLHHARDAWQAADARQQWRELNYTAKPSYESAVAEYDGFAGILEARGIDVAFVGPETPLTLDAIYVRDAAVVCDRGAILCKMGKPARADEPDALAQAFRRLDVPIVGRIEGAGRLEGGDVVWLDADTVTVGHGYRSNDEGIRQFTDILGRGIDVVTVDLPHYRGAGDVFHLMSILSPLDRDLALIYSPLMPVRFRNMLIDRGLSLVEVPDEEFESMACNVLAIAPRECVALADNPVTRERMETAGVTVHTYDGAQISRNGQGGPTCLTRPLERSA